MLYLIARIVSQFSEHGSAENPVFCNGFVLTLDWNGNSPNRPASGRRDVLLKC
jgi:hypothetical protein